MRNVAGDKYKILERKSSKFGVVGYVDKQSGLEKIWTGKTIAYYDDMKRKDAYKTCLDRYMHDQLARPIINTIVHGIFSKPPDFQGDEKLVKRAQKIVKDSQIDWNIWGVDLETFGDLFLRTFFGDNAKIASIPAESLDIEYDQKNVLNIKGYSQFKDEKGKGDFISPDEMVHLKINAPTSVVYGSSTLRPVLWWFDVLDNLWERNWIRAAQYYGAPIIAVVGVPVEHQTSVRTSLEADGQRPGRNWVFPEDVKIEVPDLTKNYPIEQLIDRVYQYILAACGIPQHLVYESDSSRGVAMFSGDGFEMMIKAKRLTWSLGLIKAMRLIFEDEKLVKSGREMDFRVNWAPVFMRDLKNLASLVDILRTNKIASLQTSREMVGIDHSEEDKRMENDPEEELPMASPTGRVPTKVAPATKTTPRK